MEPEGYKFDPSDADDVPFLDESPPDQREPLPSEEVAIVDDTSFHDIPPEIFTDLIIPFIGDFYYRFVGMVNHTFHEAYVNAFPEKRTRFNASTKEHAVICYQENDRKKSLPILCPLLARSGDLSTLRHLRQLDVFSADSSFSGKESFGFSILEWSRERALPMDRGKTCETAAAVGHLEVLEWCYKNGFEFSGKSCVKRAARNGHLDVLKWCNKDVWFLDEDTCIAAAENGHVDVIKWCLERDCPWDERIYIVAAQNGHVEVLKWCYENKFPWRVISTMCCINAARNGHLGVVQWCSDHSYVRSDAVLFAMSVYAAKNGQIEIVKWCFAKGYPINECEILEAARNGHVETLKWCLSNANEFVLERLPEDFKKRRAPIVGDSFTP